MAAQARIVDLARYLEGLHVPFMVQEWGADQQNFTSTRAIQRVKEWLPTHVLVEAARIRGMSLYTSHPQSLHDYRILQHLLDLRFEQWATASTTYRNMSFPEMEPMPSSRSVIMEVGKRTEVLRRARRLAAKKRWDVNTAEGRRNRWPPQCARICPG